MTVVTDGVGLRTSSGAVIDGRRWAAAPEPADVAALARCRPPVLDVGCGPGRHTLALARSGVPALGVDISEPALDRVRHHGAPVLHRSVFERLPGTGRWGTVLLLDGNLGIGGDPSALLRRAVELLAPDGRVIAEVDPPDSPSRTPSGPTSACLELDGVAGPWFPWTHVGVDHVDGLAASAGLSVDEAWVDDDRWFVVLGMAP